MTLKYQQSVQAVLKVVLLLQVLSNLAQIIEPRIFLLGLVRNEIVGNAIFMLLAGHDTAASTMTSLLFNLATHVVEQIKLVEEVDRTASEQASYAHILGNITVLTANSLLHWLYFLGWT